MRMGASSRSPFAASIAQWMALSTIHLKLGAFHFLAPVSAGTAGVEGGRLKKGLRQE